MKRIEDRIAKSIVARSQIVKFQSTPPRGGRLPNNGGNEEIFPRETTFTQNHI